MSGSLLLKDEQTAGASIKVLMQCDLICCEYITQITSYSHGVESIKDLVCQGGAGCLQCSPAEGNLSKEVEMFTWFCLLFCVTGEWTNCTSVNQRWFCHFSVTLAGQFANTFSVLTCARWGETGFFHAEEIQEATSRASPQTSLASLSSPSPWQIYWEFNHACWKNLC